MAVGAASPAVGHAAAAKGEATSEVAGKEEPLPVEGVLRTGTEGEGPGPSEGVPVVIAVEGEEEAAAAEDEEEVKWLKHYSSTQSILTVGDGDFSFSLALATAFSSGALLVATSLDTYEVLIGKYREAESNIMKLKRLKATVLHGVDVKRMKFHTDLQNRRFDRIVFNFPHAGFRAPEDHVHMINLHKDLLRGFFHNACHLLMPCGEIHVSHKTGRAYDRWDLEVLASESSLIMFEKVVFHKADYPGYNQKRGDHPRCDKPFPLGPSCTFKFRIGRVKKRKKLNGSSAGSILSLGGSNVHPEKMTIDTRPSHPPPLVHAGPRSHFPPSVNIVRMPRTLQPCIVDPRQQPGSPLNFNGIVRAPFHHQGTAPPMLSFRGPSLNAFPFPGGIPPPMDRITCPNLIAPQEQPWYQQRNGIVRAPFHQQCTVPPVLRMPGPSLNVPAPGSIPPPKERIRCPNLLAPQDQEQHWYQQRTVADLPLPVRDSNSYFEHQRRLQRQRMMPGAFGLSYSSAFLEDRRRESAQKIALCRQR